MHLPKRDGVLAGLVRDTGGILVAWSFMIAAEFVAVGMLQRALFAGSWELILARRTVAPIALAMLVPAAPVAVLLARVAALSRRVRWAPAVLGIVLGVFGAVVAFLVTNGRHFANAAVRAPFVVAVGLTGVLMAHFLVPASVRLLESRRGRGLALAVGGSIAVLAWGVDARVLPRLYPAFHWAMFIVALGAGALTSFAWRTPGGPPRSELLIGLGGTGIAAVAVAWMPHAARSLSHADNLRIVLEEHAPILGRAVVLAARLAPAPSIDVASSEAPVPGEVKRALDWTGDDLLLVTVDALRADHVSAYGYSRPTTPNIDKLAAQGAMFTAAYCPTPHTSYSITSMMTGKDMRPLLSLGLGLDSDTWATDLRRYGYKTAAFYPPAVFYIDADRFMPFQESGLGFEYRWVEFTSAEEKVAEVARYLETAPPSPLFLWVHLFEPHEPYVSHEAHRFAGDSAADLYDSEVAYADAAIGVLVQTVRAKRPRTAIIVTADHGEEFGEHGGRYHGTTCYEEQVRVPLVIVGPGVSPRRVPTVVQTIDLLPSVLSALGIPRPARVRGRDIGALLAPPSDAVASPDPGLAYAETDEQTLLARGDDRLVCLRRLGACALYDVKADPGERTDRAASEPDRVRELRALTAGIELSQGRYEVATVPWPDALRRGLQGEIDAAPDVAALLDDASLAVRRKAAEVTFRLASPEVVPEVRHAADRADDPDVRRWCVLSLVRMGEPAGPLAQALVHDPDIRWRRAASLAFALRGDARGRSELASWWVDAGPPHLGLDLAQAKVLLDAIGRARAAEAIPGLLRSMDYVPTRAAVAEALGRIGDVRVRPALLRLFESERYETARSGEARALIALGGGRDMIGPLARFAGLPDPMIDAIQIARDGKLLDPRTGGVLLDSPSVDVSTSVHVATNTPLRLWVLAAGPEGELVGEVAGDPLPPSRGERGVYMIDLPPRRDPVVALHLRLPSSMVAAWIVPRLAALPLPDAGQTP